MTATARIPNQNRDGWISVEYRPGTLDENILDEVWLGDSYHLEGIRHIINDGVVIDVGANIGAVTLRCLDLGARHVVAVEPETENADLFRTNLAGDDRVTGITAIVGDPNTRVVMAGTSGDAHAEPAEDGWPPWDFARVLNVAFPLLADADPPKGIAAERIALLKVDVEGAEYDWFATATPALLDRVDRIAMEWHGRDNYGVNEGDYGRLLTTLARTHSCQVFGYPDKGGHLYAHHY